MILYFHLGDMPHGIRRFLLSNELNAEIYKPMNDAQQDRNYYSVYSIMRTIVEMRENEIAISSKTK